jgi:hypothetical protein
MIDLAKGRNKSAMVSNLQNDFVILNGVKNLSAIEILRNTQDDNSPTAYC